MGSGQAQTGDATSRKRVIVVENGKEYVEAKRIPQWVLYSLIGAQSIFLICAGIVGYRFYMQLRPISPSVHIQEAAKLLGIPMSGNSIMGVTFVKDNKEGTSVNMSYVCTNCGFHGPTFAIQYPEKPGPGWRSYKPPAVDNDSELISSTPNEPIASSRRPNETGGRQEEPGKEPVREYVAVR